jgi:hypothetical protein
VPTVLLVGAIVAIYGLLADAGGADADAVARLEALYREARFSEHEIHESHRQAAIEALRAIHTSIGIGAGAR